MSLQESQQFDTFIVIATNSKKNYSKSQRGKYVDLIISLPTDSGFSVLNNEAVDEVLKNISPEYFIFINDDAWIRSDFYIKLAAVIKKHSPDIIAPLIFEGESNVVDSYGVEYFRSGYAKNNTSFSNKTTLATAACMIVKTTFLQKLKRTYGFYFNPVLHFYLEDVEFSIRAVMQNAKILKSEELIVKHLGSTSAGKRSYFTMFQTYRNIIWVILLTWPIKYIIAHLPSIILVQAWVFLYGSVIFGPQLYLRVIRDTLQHIPQLLTLRNQIVGSYKNQNHFSKLFSKLTFRTYHGIKIKVS